jgi:hypothetical protein
MIYDITGIKATASAKEKEKSEKGNIKRRWNGQLRLFAVSGSREDTAKYSSAV